jgi:hypothetical protein
MMFLRQTSQRNEHRSKRIHAQPVEQTLAAFHRLGAKPQNESVVRRIDALFLNLSANCK